MVVTLDSILSQIDPADYLPIAHSSLNHCLLASKSSQHWFDFLTELYILTLVTNLFVGRKVVPLVQLDIDYHCFFFWSSLITIVGHQYERNSSCPTVLLAFFDGFVPFLFAFSFLLQSLICPFGAFFLPPTISLYLFPISKFGPCISILLDLDIVLWQLVLNWSDCYVAHLLRVLLIFIIYQLQVYYSLVL